LRIVSSRRKKAATKDILPYNDLTHGSYDDPSRDWRRGLAVQWQGIVESGFDFTCGKTGA
jgi:hypothetical protein